MPPLFHFNYNNDRHQNIFISTPIILLILLLLSRGRMFSFVEDLEEKEAKINLEKDEAGELKGDNKLEEGKTEEKEVEQQQESEEKRFLNYFGWLRLVDFSSRGLTTPWLRSYYS
uniref:Uncharacterized protein n=1 Tax=Meloidogyne enterolobii TaxID=390850 RepID=A0A6V7VSW2_MELEN|nr:unnamed protein product [Meloidogyne enterolobii]